MRTCTKCGELKAIEEFPDHRGYRENRCKKCKTAHSKEWRLSNMESARTACRKYHSSAHGRALMVLLGMKRRSHKEGWIPPEFTVEEIAGVLDGGLCAQTGIPFDLERTEHSQNNPFAPSPDRIDSSKGYTKDNVQFVCWMYNAMKSDFPPSAVARFIAALTDRH